MSYLVDALKKAERERHARQGQELHLVSAGAANAAAPSRAGPWLWLVAILVATNVALAIYVWRPRPATSAPTMPLVAKPPFTHAKPWTPPAPGLVAKKRDSATKNDQDKTTAGTQAGSADGEAGAAGSQAPPTTADGANRRAAGAEAHNSASQHGRVVHSRVPLTGGGPHNTNATTESSEDNADGSNAPDQSALSDVPTIQINGQLYSTVPGRSFILVNGRRYHEGERLAAGPAVESIGLDGATLRYHGQRYHVAGPG